MLPARIAHTAALVFLTITGLATATQATTPPSFTLHLSQSLTVGTQPLSAATGDFNHDGFQDIVVANHGSASVSVLLGKGDGTFHTPVNYTVPAGAYGVTVGDFNGDGFLDIAVTSTSAKNVTILLGNGDGTFKTPGKSFSTGGESFAIAAGDVSGDRKVDLVVANYDTGRVGVLLGNGDGTFQAVMTVAAGSNARALALADFNQDGKLDLAVANELKGTVTVLLGNGDGTFNAGIPYPLLGQSASSIAVGDFFGNGLADLLVANDAATGGDIEVLPNGGSGVFGTAVSLGAAGGTVPISVVAADFNGDSTWDAAFALKGSNTLGWLAGDGNGAFTSETTAATGTGPFFLATGDFNGDGIADVVVVNSTANSIYVFTAVPSAGANIPKVWLSASYLNFGNQLAGAASRNLLLQMRYTGGGPLTIYGITTSGEFNQKNDCGTTLTAGTMCTIEVLTTPAAGNNNGSLSLNFNGSGLGYVDLVSQGLTQLFSASPTSVAFPAQVVNSTSAPRSVTITNNAAHTVTLGAITTSSPFSQTNNCGANLLSGASCTVMVTFSPTSSGTTSGSLKIAGGGATPLSVPLTGSTTYLSFSPNPLTISTAYGTSSSATVTVNNLSSSLTVDITGVSTGDPFSATSGCGSTLAPLASCDITVGYLATLIGEQTGTLTVTDNAGGTSQQVALVGNGTAVTPTISLSASPSTIIAGAIATLTATVTASGGTPITLGSVTFFDGPRNIGTVQLVRKSGSFALGTATLKTGSFRVGAHSLVARYNANRSASAVSSSAASLVVNSTGGLISTTPTLAASGEPGAYTLTADIVASAAAAPTGSLSFVDQSLGNAVISTSSISASSLVPALNFSPLANSSVISMVVGDFNGDGIPDIAGVYINSPGYVYIALGKGDGTFQTAAPFAVGERPTSVATADLDGDGKLDLIVGSSATTSLSLLYGNGNGSFQPQIVYLLGESTSGTPVGLAVGDFRGNGLVDVAVSTEGGFIYYLPTQLNGQLSNPSGPNSMACPGGEPIVAGDFTPGEGTDLIASCNEGVYGGPGQTWILTNLAAWPTVTGHVLTSVSPSALAAADLNGDGNVDAIIGGQVFLGNGDGTFQTPTTFTTNPVVTTGVGDFRGDGILDIATLLNFPAFDIELFRGDAAGTYVPGNAYSLSGTSDVGPILVADFNNDGTPDVAYDFTNPVLLGRIDSQTVLSNFGIAGTGTHNIIAKYSGDSHYAASQSSALPLPEGVPNFGAYSINYGTIAPGTQRILNVRLYNASSSSITFALGFSPTSSPFAIATGTSCGTSLPASGSCTVQISFTPPTTGSYNATLSATGSSGSASIALTGNAN